MPVSYEDAMLDYMKVKKIITSCETMMQLSVAREVTKRYHMKYGQCVSHNLSMVLTSQEVYLLNTTR